MNNVTHKYKGWNEVAYKIVRFETIPAYARSGNAHNPTKRYYYAIFQEGSTECLATAPNLKMAKQICDCPDEELRPL